jgi:hypothetical protein
VYKPDILAQQFSFPVRDCSSEYLRPRSEMDSVLRRPMKCLQLAGYNEQGLTTVNLGLYLIHIPIDMRKL